MAIKLTKIIATLGPATGSRKKIKELISAGVNVFRLNLSHGDHAAFRKWIRWIRQAEKELNTLTGILLDLQGPKIRVGEFENGFIHLHSGDKAVFTTRKITGKDKLVPVQYAKFHAVVKPGDLVYLDDGNICVQVKKVSGPDVTVEVKVGGSLSNFKGVNMPDATLSGSPITKKDKKDLAFGLKEGVDFVALSFVSSPRDIHQLRRMIQKAGSKAEIIAKIERKKALKYLSEIVQATDSVMVARGDLGIEIPITDVPRVQKDIIRECTLQHKPVIIATQMLESMIENPRPTRAEVSDVSSAVEECADAIMLSGETAVGQYPLETVSLMAETARSIETYQFKNKRIVPWRVFFDDNPPINVGITYSANRMVELLHCQALIVFTLTGGTARMVASPRPVVPVFSFTSNRETARRLTLIRGTVPFIVKKEENFLGNMKGAFNILKKARHLKKGDRVVITAGVPLGIPSWTNVLRVEVVP